LRKKRRKNKPVNVAVKNLIKKKCPILDRGQLRGHPNHFIFLDIIFLMVSVV
tara:strand:- start:190 stop:345 length:156 start_codon:yes stop_codon:yes gene_type:complete